MVIQKLILHGYKRFSLRNITTLEYTPKQPLQLILGGNGAGKSSLLKELSPLPALLKKDYTQDGYKIIHISHNSNSYILTSRNNKHSFICNNIELNNSSTISVQYELVQQHFNLTPEIMDILLNNTKFTDMSIADRKKYLSQLSCIDYQYSLSIYNQLKSRLRDVQGGIKLLEDNIIQSKTHTLQQDYITKLQKDKEVLEEFHSYIMSLYDHNVTHTQLPDLQPTLTKLKTLLDLNVTGNIHATSEEITITKTKLENISTSITTTLKQIEELESIANIQDITKLEQQLLKYQQQVQELQQYNIHKLSSCNINSILTVLPCINTTLTSLLSELSNYDSIRLIPQEQQEQLPQQHRQYTQLIQLYNNKISLAQEELNTLNAYHTQDNLITCPKCNYEFYNKFNQQQVNNLELIIKNYNIKLQQATNILHTLTTKLDSYNKKNEVIQSLYSLINSHPLLKPYWHEFLDNIDFTSSSITDITSTWNTITINIQKLSSLPTLEQEITNLTNTIITYRSITTQYNSKQLSQLRNTYEELVNQQHNLTQHLNDTLLPRLNIITKIQSTQQQLITNLIAIRKNLNSNITTIRNNIVLDYANTIQQHLHTISTTLQQHHTHLTQLSQYQQQLQHYNKLSHVLNSMLTSLSPTQGLIAQSISSFLTLFIHDINSIISKIWTYPLELQLPTLTQEDITYKFQVIINHTSVIQDISQLSSSGQEILNLAFRLIFMKYFHLNSFPLYLDELGYSMDVEHTHTLYNTIDKILTQQYPQIFFISHNETQYGHLSYADFNVLDANNIGLSSIPTYNTNLILK